MASRQSANPYNAHERVTLVATVNNGPPYQLLYVVATGTLVTFNEDGSTTDWGSPANGAMIPGPHYGVDDGSTATVNGWRNKGE